ncbi:MAG: TCR/Tet family MFS transporter [Acidobacteria bacterium]|nr:TCR/Tet family MFS transporter [Acidobacteriota bacterium]
MPPNRKALTFLLLTVFLDLLGAGILLPVIPYLVKPYRADATTVGLLTLAFSAAQFLATPVLGALSDRHGRRPILLISVFGSGLGYVLFGIGGSLAVLYCSRLLDGVTGGNISTAQAYIADVTPPEDRAKTFGLIGAAFGLGFIIGPVAGGFLTHISLQAPAYAAALLAFSTTVLGYFGLPESLPPDRRRATPLTIADLNPIRTLIQNFNRPALRLLFLAAFTFNFANSGFQSNFPVFTSARFGLSPDQNGLILAGVGVAAAITQGLLVRRINPIFGERKLALAGFLTGAATLVWTAFARSTWEVTVAMGLCAFGVSLASPALLGLISQAVSGYEQGVVLGAMTSMASLARIGGPYWAGVTFDHIGPGAPYWTAALWLLAGFAFIWMRSGQPATGRSPAAATPHPR